MIINPAMKFQPKKPINSIQQQPFSQKESLPALNKPLAKDLVSFKGGYDQTYNAVTIGCGVLGSSVLALMFMIKFGEPALKKLDPGGAYEFESNVAEILDNDLKSRQINPNNYFETGNARISYDAKEDSPQAVADALNEACLAQTGDPATIVGNGVEKIAGYNGKGVLYAECANNLGEPFIDLDFQNQQRGDALPAKGDLPVQQ